MKRYFHFIALAAVAGLFVSSCNKDDATPEQEPKTKLTANVEFLVVIPDGQEKYVDQSYEYSIDGKSTTITPSQMKDVTTSKDYSDIYNETKDYFTTNKIKEGFKIFHQDVGTLEEGQTVKFGQKTYTAKTVSPTVDSIYLFDSFHVLISKLSYASSKGLASGFSSDALWQVCPNLSGNMGVSYTVYDNKYAVETEE